MQSQTKMFYQLILLTLCIFVLDQNSTFAQTSEENRKLTASPISYNSALGFLESFSDTNLPYQTDEEYAIQDTIPAEQVIQHILEASQNVAPDVFKDLWENQEMREITIKGLRDRYINVEENSFAVINFGMVNKLNISEKFQTVIFKYIPTFMEGIYSYTYLANYDTKGNLIDIVKIGGMAGYVDMQNKWSATVSKNGKIEVKGKSVKNGQMFGTNEDFIETAELTYQLDKEGNINLTKQKFSSFSGSFIRETHEEIIHIEEFFDEINIIYQPSPDNFSEQPLKVINFNKKKNQIITQFPDSLEQVVITYNANHTRFICKNESGDTWEYTRSKF